MKKDVAELKKELEEVEALYEETKHTLDSDNRWRSYLVFLVIFSSLSSCFTLSKYMSSIQSENSVAQVAKFDVVVESDLPNDVSFGGYLSDKQDLNGEIKYPYKEFNLYITNNSEVKTRAVLTMSINPSANFDISLFDKDGKEVLNPTIKTYKNRMNPNEKITLRVRIDPKPLKKNGNNKVSVSSNVSFKVHSEQID